MARRPPQPGVELAIQMPAADVDPSGDELRWRASDAAIREKRLNRFVWFVAFVEWSGNALGTLAFLWATVVLLGGFCMSLDPKDFWYNTAMIFVEAFRMFSRNYRLDDQSLFRTTGRSDGLARHSFACSCSGRSGMKW
ncbi:unnamed protein product [Urochloa humidicola]